LERLPVIFSVKNPSVTVTDGLAGWSTQADCHSFVKVLCRSSIL